MKTRLLLRDVLKPVAVGKKITRAVFDRVVDLVWETLPGDIPKDTLEESLQHLLGTTPDIDTITNTAWRMAGNAKRLLQHKPVPPWHLQRFPEWVPMQVLSVSLSKNSKQKIGATLSCRVLAGTSCPLILKKWWSLEQCRYFSTEFGFSLQFSRRREPPKLPYHSPQEFVNLRFYGLVEPELCTTEPVFSHPGFPGCVHKYNVDILNCRNRIQYTCPENLPNDFRCYTCPRGYASGSSDTSCKAATHRLAWVQKPCPECKDAEAWFDPEFHATVCVDCVIKSLYSRKQ